MGKNHFKPRNRTSFLEIKNVLLSVDKMFKESRYACVPCQMAQRLCVDYSMEITSVVLVTLLIYTIYSKAYQFYCLFKFQRIKHISSTLIKICLLVLHLDQNIVPSSISLEMVVLTPRNGNWLDIVIQRSLES